MADLGCDLHYGHDGDHAWSQEVRHGAGGSYYEGIQIEVRWRDLKVEEQDDKALDNASVWIDQEKTSDVQPQND